ncbi:MAG TPA: ankyrin repeat domain-containing protein, partial [Spirochaetota bacterium]|nr:ankyrin repeat domain-containing protein [Spirochaetota bacterium]
MNSYIERVLHCTLDDGDYSPLLHFCINAAVNLLVSFPDISRDADGKFIPFEETRSDISETVTEYKKFFGNRSTGIEVTLLSGEGSNRCGADSGDSVTVETYGLPDRCNVLVKSLREAGESKYNRTVELHLTAPQIKAAALIELFKSALSPGIPGDEKIKAIKQDISMKLRTGNLSETVEGARYILLHCPEDQEALVILGQAMVQEGDWRGGKKNLLRAIEILPENPDAWYNLGIAYMQGSDNSSALRCFGKTLEYDPEHHGAYYMTGVILEETGKSDEAVAAYRYAVKYSPGSHKAGMNSGMFFVPQAKGALERLGIPWRGDEELPDPEGVDINEDLVRAASAGDTRKIVKLLKEGAVPDYRSHQSSMHGRTPLITAALNGHTNAVKYLLEHGAGIDYQDLSGCTALASVIEWGGDRDIIRLLAENGADVNGKDPYGRPLILNERVLCDPVILIILADAGADINAAADTGANGVYYAAAAGNRESALFFIEHGADINCRSRSGATPLMAAAINGDRNMILFLIEKGCSPGIPDHEGRTPLMAAAEKADVETVAILIAAGADVNARDNMGRSAMDIILESGRRDDMEAYRK